MENLMKDLPVVVFLDHLLIMGHSEKEHRDILQEVLQHFLENDLQLQHSKCEFSKTQVDYLSHILDKQVIHPSKDEVRAIQEAPSPTNVKELQAFLGLVNYYGRFVPQQSTVLAPLHKRLREHATWKWAEVEPAAFLKCREQLHGLKQKKKIFWLKCFFSSCSQVIFPICNLWNMLQGTLLDKC